QQERSTLVQMGLDASPASLESMSSDSVLGALGGHSQLGSAEYQSATASSPEPAAASTPAPVVVIPNLDDLLLSATPEQLAKLRMLAASKGLSVPCAGPGSGTKNADGS